MNLITGELRTCIMSAFDNLHETFGNPIVVWQAAQEVVISTDPNFNGFYQGQPTNMTQLVTQSGTFQARIKWLNAQQLMQEIGLEERDEQKVNVALGGVRIRVSGDAVDWITNAEKITFNNDVHRMLQRDRPHGFFGPQYYDFILQRIP